MLTLWIYRLRDDEHPTGYVEKNVLAYTSCGAEEKLRKAYPDCKFMILVDWHEVDFE